MKGLELISRFTLWPSGMGCRLDLLGSLAGNRGPLEKRAAGLLGIREGSRVSHCLRWQFWSPASCASHRGIHSGSPRTDCQSCADALRCGYRPGRYHMPFVALRARLYIAHGNRSSSSARHTVGHTVGHVVVMRQVPVMRTVSERPPGSGGRIIVPGSWIIVLGVSYRGGEKEFRRKPLQSERWQE